MKVNYCEQCKKWTGASKVCPDCKTPCVEKDLSSARGDYYFIDGVDKPLARVTKILEASNKEGLNYWIAKQAVIAALENPLLTVGEAMASRFKKRDKAGMKGTDIHKIIQNIGNGTPNSDQLEIPQIQAYEKFRKDTPHKILSSEQRVYSLKYGFAGTLDAIIQTDRKIILDYKTSKAIRDTNPVQLTAYKHALAEMNGEEILKYPMAILHLKPDATYSFVEVEDEWEVFLAHLTIYRWQNL